MNLSEFKAWFEGFTEDMDGPPNAKQWKKIKARVSEITPDPTPMPVIVDRYIRPLQPYWPGPIWASYEGKLYQGNATATAEIDPKSNLQAFNMVGKADAKMIAAS